MAGLFPAYLGIIDIWYAIEGALMFDDILCLPESALSLRELNHDGLYKVMG